MKEGMEASYDATWRFDRDACCPNCGRPPVAVQVLVPALVGLVSEGMGGGFRVGKSWTEELGGVHLEDGGCGCIMVQCLSGHAWSVRRTHVTERRVC
jgi:hypothetical protein